MLLMLLLGLLGLLMLLGLLLGLIQTKENKQIEIVLDVIRNSQPISLNDELATSL